MISCCLRVSSLRYAVSGAVAFHGPMNGSTSCGAGSVWKAASSNKVAVIVDRLGEVGRRSPQVWTRSPPRWRRVSRVRRRRHATCRGSSAYPSGAGPQPNVINRPCAGHQPAHLLLHTNRSSHRQLSPAAPAFARTPAGCASWVTSWCLFQAWDVVGAPSDAAANLIESLGIRRARRSLSSCVMIATTYHSNEHLCMGPAVC